MSKIKLSISTPYGSRYSVNEQGHINNSPQWIFAGIEHVKKSWFIPFSEITPELIHSLPLLYKNGHPQFTVRDIDHGTTRTWGNTKFHGIQYIAVL